MPTMRARELDAAMRVELAYPGGVTGPRRAAPGQRLLVTACGRTTERRYGDSTSYTCQLAALAATLLHGAAFGFPIDDSVATAELIDECYRRAGLTPRGA